MDGSWDTVHDKQMDGQMEKVTYRGGGAPPKKGSKQGSEQIFVQYFMYFQTGISPRFFFGEIMFDDA